MKSRVMAFFLSDSGARSPLLGVPPPSFVTTFRTPKNPHWLPSTLETRQKMRHTPFLGEKDRRRPETSIRDDSAVEESERARRSPHSGATVSYPAAILTLCLCR